MTEYDMEYFDLLAEITETLDAAGFSWDKFDRFLQLNKLIDQ